VQFDNMPFQFGTISTSLPSSVGQATESIASGAEDQLIRVSLKTAQEMIFVGNDGQ